MVPRKRRVVEHRCVGVLETPCSLLAGWAESGVRRTSLGSYSVYDACVVLFGPRRLGTVWGAGCLVGSARRGKPIPLFLFFPVLAPI